MPEPGRRAVELNDAGAARAGNDVRVETAAPLFTFTTCTSSWCTQVGRVEQVLVERQRAFVVQVRRR